jgi:3-oxoacyl-[acyl-carrier-protein] synthase II
MTIPSIQGISVAIEMALQDSKISISDVDYISAHGTGTRENDVTECKATQRVFGEFSKKIPMSSIKSMLGHTMGAASAVEAAACCLVIQHGILPPTINLEAIDEDCGIDCVPNKSRQKKVNIVLNNSFAFGGNNMSLILGRYRRDLNICKKE